MALPWAVWAHMDASSLSCDKAWQLPACSSSCTVYHTRFARPSKDKGSCCNIKEVGWWWGAGGVPSVEVDVVALLLLAVVVNS